MLKGIPVHLVLLVVGKELSALQTSVLMVVTTCFATAKAWYKTHFCAQVLPNSKHVSLPSDFSHDVTTGPLAEVMNFCSIITIDKGGKKGTRLLYLGTLFSQNFEWNETTEGKISLPHLLVTDKATAKERTSYKLTTPKLLRDTLGVSVD